MNEESPKSSPRRRWFVILAIGLAVAAISGVSWYLLAVSEPVYEGLSVREWMRVPQKDYPKLPFAMAHFGEAGVPWIAEELQASYPVRGSDWYQRTLDRLPEKVGEFLPAPVNTSAQRSQAMDALASLPPGELPSVESLMPVLGEVYGSETNYTCRQQILRLARNEVPAGFPVIIEAMLHDPSPGLRIEAAAAMGRLSVHPGEYLPPMVKGLEDPDKKVAYQVVKSLANWGADAINTVPHLRKLEERLRADGFPHHALAVGDYTDSIESGRGLPESGAPDDFR